MHILISDIEWDTEGMSLAECLLPQKVLVLDIKTMYFYELSLEGSVPDNDGTSASWRELSDVLSDAFGFCHFGFNWAVFDAQTHTHAGGAFYPDDLAVCHWGKSDD